MATGTVKWFDDEKGFGFITDDAGGKDLFVHFSDVEKKSAGRVTLVEGEPVEFSRENAPKGMKAIEVVRLS